MRSSLAWANSPPSVALVRWRGPRAASSSSHRIILALAKDARTTRNATNGHRSNGLSTKMATTTETASASLSSSSSSSVDPDADTEKSPDRSAFIFGLGYTGLGLACLLLDEGWSVAGTVRSAEAARALESSVPGLRAFAFNRKRGGGQDEMVEALRGATHVFSTVPPTKEEDDEKRGISGGDEEEVGVDPVLAAHARDIFSSSSHDNDDDDVFSVSSSRSRRRQRAPFFVGYVSSTSVYGGDRNGEVVDEQSEPRPDDVTPSGALRLRAEAAWARAAKEAAAEGARLRRRPFPLPPPRPTRLAIVRAGGIYGPGRSALDSEEVIGSSSIGGVGKSDDDAPPHNTTASSSSSSAAAASSSEQRPRHRRRPSRELPEESERPTARIHVLDLCRLLRSYAVLLSEEQGEKEQEEGGGEEEEGEEGKEESVGGGDNDDAVVVICNAVDGDPVPRSAALRAARELLRIQEEEKEEEDEAEEKEKKNASTTTTATAAAEEAKKKKKKRGKVVCGERTWSRVGLEPLFRSVFDGLRSIRAGDVRPFRDERVVPERKRARGRRRKKI